MMDSACPDFEFIERRASDRVRFFGVPNDLGSSGQLVSRTPEIWAVLGSEAAAFLRIVEGDATKKIGNRFLKTLDPPYPTHPSPSKHTSNKTEAAERKGAGILSPERVAQTACLGRR